MHTRVCGAQPVSVVAASVWGMTTTPDLDAGDFRTPVPLRRNRLHSFAGRTHEVLDEIGQPSTWAMTPHERGETIAELLALRSRIDAHLFAVVADADRDDVAATAGATTTAAWVRAISGITRAEATRLVRQSRAIEPHPPTHTALAEGAIHTEQATVIVAAVDALPTELADRAPDAETHLLVAGRTARRPRPPHPGQAPARSPRPRPGRRADRPTPRTRGGRGPQNLPPQNLVRWPRLDLRPVQDPRPDRRDPDHRTRGLRQPQPARPDHPTRRAAGPGVRAGVLRTARTPAPRPAPPVRRSQRHGAGHDDPRHPARRTTRRQHPGHRHPALPQPSPPPGRRRRHHPRRPRRPLPTPRPRHDDAPSPSPNASPWPSAKADCATSRAANAPPPGATQTTENPGAKAAAPPSTTENSSAPATTPWSTKATTTQDAHRPCSVAADSEALPSPCDQHEHEQSSWQHHGRSPRVAAFAVAERLETDRARALTWAIGRARGQHRERQDQDGHGGDRGDNPSHDPTVPRPGPSRGRRTRPCRA